jgi:hypothetical protein
MTYKLVMLLLLPIQDGLDRHFNTVKYGILSLREIDHGELLSSWVSSSYLQYYRQFEPTKNCARALLIRV